MPHRVGGPLPISARQGRQMQKYGEDGERLVAGCIPVRYLPDKLAADGVEVLMITSRGGQGLVFPKGGWEEDETVEAAAKRETVEEAGVRGELELPLLGAFPFSSGKAERLATAQKGRCLAYVFAMAVSEVLDIWPEATQRGRAWYTLREAYARARYDWMRDALRAFIERKGWSAGEVLGAAAALTPPSADLACASPSPGDGAATGPAHEPESPGIAVQT